MLPLTALVEETHGETHLVDPTASCFYNVHLPILGSDMCLGHKDIVLAPPIERKSVL